jgi:hypothetical protein
MADVDSLSMSSIVPGSLRKSLPIFQNILNGRRFAFFHIIHFFFLLSLFQISYINFLKLVLYVWYMLTVSAATMDSGDVRKLDEMTCQSLASDSGWKYVTSVFFYFYQKKVLPI